MGDKDDHNGLNMKNAGGDRNQGPAGGPGSSGGPAGGGAPRFDRIIIYVIIGLLVTMLLNGLFVRIMGNEEKEISYSQFIDMVENGKVEAVDIDQSNGQITIKAKSDAGNPFGVYYYTGYVANDTELMGILRENDVETGVSIPTQTSPIISMLLSWVLPLLLIWWLMSFMSRKLMGKMGGGMGGMGKSNAKVYVQNGTGITFKDVAGQDEAKESLMEIVDYLHDPKKYTEIGAKLPKGALLVGPPGTGKTLLAKAVAGEAGVPFFSISGSDFVEMFVGMGASRVRDLLSRQKKRHPVLYLSMKSMPSERAGIIRSEAMMSGSRP